MVLLLKGSRTEVAQLRVQPLPIIKHFHVLKQLSCRFLLRIVDNIDALYLQCGKPTLSRRIVVAVSRGAHARQDLPGSQHPLIVTTGILAAAIRVVDEPRTGSTATRCHTQGGQNEMATPVIANRPADNETRVKVDDNRQVEPTFPSCHIRDIGTPFLVGGCRREILLEPVWCNRLGMLRVGGSPITTPSLAADAMIDPKNWTTSLSGSDYNPKACGGTEIAEKTPPT
jgi:hypothetical protein